MQFKVTSTSTLNYSGLKVATNKVIDCTLNTVYLMHVINDMINMGI